jgi:hypothetical protein
MRLCTRLILKVTFWDKSGLPVLMGVRINAREYRGSRFILSNWTYNTAIIASFLFSRKRESILFYLLLTILTYIFPHLWYHAVMNLPHRLLIVDIDGLRQDVFHQALSSGKIPNLARLLAGPGTSDNGIHLDPVSPAPSITFCAQSSIFTGAPPKRHGIAGNQFFDRFGLQGNGPRFYAFDVGDALAYDDAVLTFTGKSGLVGQVIAVEVPTLYEMAAARGLSSTVVYHMVSRGASQWIRPSLVDIARFTRGGGLVGMSAEEYDGEMIDRTIQHLRGGAQPDILTVYFMGLDHTSHHYGPGTQANYLSSVVDALVGKLLVELGMHGWLEGTLTLVVSDHGQIEVVPDDRHSLRLSFPFDREMGYLFDALGLDVHDKPKEGPACEAVVASNGGLAYVYLRRGAGNGQLFGEWNAVPRFRQDVLPVARAFWEAHTTARYAPDLLGALDMVLVRNVERDGWDAAYEALTQAGDLQPVEEFLAAHADIQQADALPRLRDLAGPLSGDVLLVSNYSEGFYFGGPTLGVHGGLHPDDSQAVASFGWMGAAPQQWSILREVVEASKNGLPEAEGRSRSNLIDVLPILTRVMGWEGQPAG